MKISIWHWWFLIGLLPGCAQQQYVFYIDTDAVVPSQLLAPDLVNGNKLSMDAAIDSVRVDILTTDGIALDSCQFFVPEKDRWPLSLGIAPRPDGRPVRLRVRGFRGRYAQPDSTAQLPKQCGVSEGAGLATTLTEPPTEITIDRLVDLPPPAAAMDSGVTLSLACMGIPPSFLAGTTCVKDASQPQAASQTDEGAGSATRAGTAQLAKPVPCDETMRPVLTKMEALCIPGGLTIQGDTAVVGLSSLRQFDPVPLRVVYSAPFYMDKTEFTVERIAALRLRDLSLPVPAAKNDPNPNVYNSVNCTWQSGANIEHLPVNCVTPAQAAAHCAADHGALPRESQWEHAARGSGEHRTAPWGESKATCCTASLSRLGGGVQAECAGQGIEPVGSHLGVSCAGGGDITADGVWDLGGSLIEFTRDGQRRYADRCGLPAVGVAFDPFCPDFGGATIARGSYWNAGLRTAFTAYRTSTVLSSIDGFRCIYPGVRS